MRKQGVELSLNVIIIAAIGLLILVILAFLVVTKLGLFGKTESTNCGAQGGICGTGACGTGQSVPASDCPAGQNCCKLVPRQVT
jgi:hypothetical protein